MPARTLSGPAPGPAILQQRNDNPSPRETGQVLAAPGGAVRGSAIRLL
jgi:hypothetical protein